jgi:transcriptional regulator with GAF, ATPase, and Fis domain
VAVTQASTIEQSEDPDLVASLAVPGAVAVFAAGAPRLLPIRFEKVKDALGAVIGRAESGALADPQVSRRHAAVVWRGGEVAVEDLGSRNGTQVNGKRLGPGERTRIADGAGTVVRVGHSVWVVVEDVRPYEGASIATDGDRVIGPILRHALDQIERHAARGDAVLIGGESGTGKEMAARTFHQASPRARGPFVAVNCAAIPATVAERLLFGAVRGAFSGAGADADGYLQAADHGVLFLDEIGELDPQVQAKLLRALEEREVIPVGAARARAVDVQFCFASLRDLRQRVEEGAFRDDLYYRIAQREVVMPPLRRRPEEISALVAREVDRLGDNLRCDASLVEACLARPWPGNVRELLGAVRRAIDRAIDADDKVVGARHLDPTAAPAAPAAPVTAPVAPRALAKEEIEQAIADAGGNLTAAAKALGMARSHFYRLLERHGIKPRPGPA